MKIVWVVGSISFLIKNYGSNQLILVRIVYLVPLDRVEEMMKLPTDYPLPNFFLSYAQKAGVYCIELTCSGTRLTNKTQRFPPFRRRVTLNGLASSTSFLKLLPPAPT